MNAISRIANCCRAWMAFTLPTGCRASREPLIRPSAAEFLHELQTLNYFARVGTGRTDKHRHALFDRLDGRRRQGLIFVPEKVIAFAETAGGGADVDAVPNDPVHARLKVVHVDGRGRFEIAAPRVENAGIMAITP